MTKKVLHNLCVMSSLTVLSVSEAVAAPAVEAGKSAPGLPQMDPTWCATQVFWLASMFIVLYLVFSKKILPDISSVLEMRREHIQSHLDNAQSLKDEAEKVYEAYNKILDEARKTSVSVFSDVDEDIKAKTANEILVFENRATKETSAFEANIEKAKANALEDMNSIAAEIAAEAAEKIIGVSTDIKKAKDVVENVSKRAKAA